MQRKQSEKNDVPRGTLSADARRLDEAFQELAKQVVRVIANDWQTFLKHRKIWFSIGAVALIAGFVAGILWTAIVKAHAHEQAIEVLPPPCLRTTEIRNGIERDFGCHNGNWRYGYQGDLPPGKPRENPGKTR